MKTIHQYLLTALAVMLTIFAAAPPAQAQSDITPPTVETCTFTPNSGDITAGPVTVTVTARFTDALSGLNAGIAFFVSPSGAQSASVSFGSGQRISGSAQDGMYQSTVEIPRYAEAGEWRIQRFYLADVAGNAATLWRAGVSTPTYPAAIDQPLTITGASDTLAPVVASCTFTPNSGDITAGPVTVTVTARFTDALSGLNAGIAFFVSPSGTQSVYAYFGSSQRISGSAQDGIYQGTVEIPRYAEAGEWRIQRFYLADVAGNAATLWRAGVSTPTYPAAIDQPLTITGTSDTLVPTVASCTFSPAQIEASAGAVTVTVTARFTDALSGLNAGIAFFVSPSGAQSAYVSFGSGQRTSGSAQDGMYQSTVEIPRYAEAGEWRIQRFYLADVAGNAANLWRVGVSTPTYPAAIDQPLQVTTDIAPSVTDTGVSALTTSGATVNATVNPRGLATTWRVEYGATSALGQSTSAPSVGNGVADVPVSYTFSGLAEGQTVFYRFAVQNGNGTNFTAATSFTTITIPNTAPTVAVDSTGAATFTSTGNLAVNRYYHASATLADGRVLVVGGSDANTGSALASAEIYDLASGMWTPAGSLAHARHAHTATRLPDGRVLVTGGYGSTGFLASAEIYNPATGLWSATASLTKARYEHTATRLIDGRVLIAGGYNGTDGLLTLVEVFDPATETWSAAAPLAKERDRHAALLLTDGKVLVVGGNHYTGPLKLAEIYDPAANTWTATGSLAVARYDYAAALLPDGGVLATGGGTSRAERYDAQSGTWSAVPVLAGSYDNHTATSMLDGRVLVVSSGSAELYDPATNIWLPTGAPSSTGYFSTANLLADGRVLLAGGFTTAAEIYGPGNAALTLAEGVAGTQAGTFSDAEGNATVTLTASSGTITQDNMAGTWIWSPAAGFDGPSSSTITITATDTASETATATFAFTVTNELPVLTITAPPAPDEDTGVSITFGVTDPSAADMAAGFDRTIDFGDSSPVVTLAGGNPNPYTTVHTYADGGDYVITLWAMDKDGGETTLTQTITIRDTTPPDTVIHQGPSGTVTTATATFVVIATEVSTFRYSLDGGPEVTAPGPLTVETDPITFTGLTAGTHTFSVYATDEAGNVDPTPATRTWTVMLDPEAQVIFAKNSPVPGAGSDARIPSGALFTALYPPAINDAGQVAYWAKWKAGTVSGAGVFVDGTLKVATGEQIPGFGSPTFSTFKDPQIAPDGSIAFLATLKHVTGASEIVLVHVSADGTVRHAAVEGTSVSFSDPVVIKKISAFKLTDHCIYWRGIALNGVPAVTAATDMIAAEWTPSATYPESPLVTTTLLIREGVTVLPFETTPVKSFTTLIAGAGSPGAEGGWERESFDPLDNNYHRGLMVSVANANGTYGVWTLSAAHAHSSFLLAFKPSVPASDGFEQAWFVSAASGKPAVVAYAQPGLTSLYGLDSIGYGYSASLFQKSKKNLVVAASTARTLDFVRTAMPVTLMGPFGAALPSTSDDAIAVGKAVVGGYGYELLAREGDTAPEVTDGATFKSFPSLTMAGGGHGALFTAKLGGATTATDDALFGVDSAGSLRLLLREGATTIGGKTVKTFAALKAAAGSSGVARNYNNNGDVVSLVTFTDGTTAIVMIALP